MFKKGDPPPAGSGRKPGRPKGALNRIRQTAREICEQENIEPVKALIRVWRSKKFPLDMRLDALKCIVRLVHPTLTAARIDANVEATLTTDIRHHISVINSDPQLAAAAEAIALRLAECPEDPLVIEAQALPDESQE
jgi:hypothetical protein